MFIEEIFEPKSCVLSKDLQFSSCFWCGNISRRFKMIGDQLKGKLLDHQSNRFVLFQNVSALSNYSFDRLPFLPFATRTVWQATIGSHSPAETVNTIRVIISVIKIKFTQSKLYCLTVRLSLIVSHCDEEAYNHQR